MPYDLKKPVVPRLAGAKLKLVRAAAETSGIGAMVYNTIAGNMGLNSLREVDMGDAPATPLPLVPRFADDDTPAPVFDADQRVDPHGFGFETVADLRAAYRDGDATPVNVAERAITAIAESEQNDPALRIFFAHDADDVRKQAEASAARWEKGEPKGPLDGVPVAIKDEINVAGYPTTLGTRFLGKEPAAEDGTAVAKIRAAGGIILGKANMTEIGIGPVGLQPHHGTARNPYDSTRVTGGSSAGPGAALAAGIAPVSLGADGGGSIRNPASFCGVVGLKATFGRISEHGVPPLCWTVAHIGPLGATARDCATMYGVMAGRDPHDHNTHGQPPIRLDGLERTDDLSDLTIGVWDEWFDDADPGVVKACRGMLEHLQAKGAKVKPVTIDGLDATRVAHLITIGTEMANAMSPFLREHRQDFAQDVRLLLAAIERFRAVEYVQAQRQRYRICQEFARIHEEVDVVVTPTNGCTAPPVPLDAALTTGESNLELLSTAMRFVIPPNMTGLPAISFPAGYDEDGLPVGFHAMGRAWEEHTLLRLAAAGEDFVERREPTHQWQLLPKA